MKGLHAGSKHLAVAGIVPIVLGGDQRPPPIFRRTGQIKPLQFDRYRLVGWSQHVQHIRKSFRRAIEWHAIPAGLVVARDQMRADFVFEQGLIGGAVPEDGLKHVDDTKIKKGPMPQAGSSRIADLCARR